MQRRTLRLSLVCAAAVLAAGVLLGLFVRPPRPVLRVAVQMSSGWLLADHDHGAVKSVLRAYLQSAVASHLADEILETPATDEEILLRMMLAIRKSVISVRSDWQLSFSPAEWPALIAGVGYCDQLNGAVCTVAAQHFPKSELIALYLPAEQWSPHTIGRVWSEQRGEWLYFDAFYREPVIFTKNAKGEIQFVKTAMKLPRSTRELAPQGIYTLDSWRLTGFPRTFAMYLVERVRGRFMPVEVAETEGPQPGATPQPAAEAGSAPGSQPPVAVATSTMISPPPEAGSNVGTPAGPVWVFPTQKSSRVLSGPPILRPEPRGVFPNKVDDELYRRVVRDYAKARVLHLLGKPDRDAYRVVAASANASKDDRAWQIVATARKFVERPEL